MADELYSQKYTLVHFVHPVEVGTHFHMDNWPLHVTLADVFAINRQATNIDIQLETTLARRSPVEVRTAGGGTLGSAPITLLEASRDLLQLHNQIMDLLEANNAVFNSPQFTRRGYVAHSTVQRNEELQPGVLVKIDTVTFIDMFPAGDWQQREVLNIFKMLR